MAVREIISILNGNLKLQAIWMSRASEATVAEATVNESRTIGDLKSQGWSCCVNVYVHTNELYEIKAHPLPITGRALAHNDLPKRTQRSRMLCRPNAQRVYWLKAKHFLRPSTDQGCSQTVKALL